MPIKVQNDLPARAILESENIFVMDENRAMSQDIRPLQILILNLMPIKEDTETQLLRALSNTPLQVDCTFLMLSTHVSKNTSASHLNKFYVTFDEIRRRKFDGMIITGAPVENLDFTDVRGMEGIKEATYPVAGLEVKVAIASGLGNAKKLLEKVKSGEATYHFIEIMGCPGGCINGGGQPQQPGYVRNTVDIRGLRAKVLYDSDKNNPIRKSHENPAIKELYATFLGEPGSEKAHHLLHTTYIKRKVNEI